MSQKRLCKVEDTHPTLAVKEDGSKVWYFNTNGNMFNTGSYGYKAWYFNKSIFD